jgi:hypothetical protein
MRWTKTFLRTTAAGLALVFFLTNVLLAHSTEVNFWSERKKETPQLAALPSNFQANPAQIFQSLPKLPRPAISLSKQLTKDIPKGLAVEYGALLQALPASVGTVRSISIPANKKSSKTVIHFQDVHMNPEAQQNIGKAIQELVSQKKVDLVALEGAFGPMDFSVFRKFPYSDSVKAVADYLLKENKISGAVYTAFTSPAEIPPFVGVDQLQHYNANVNAYKASAPLVKKYKDQFLAQERVLNQEASKTFNKELASFDARVHAYRQGTFAWGDYVSLLAQHSESVSTDVEIFLQALDQERKLDFAQVERERTQLLTQLVSKLTKDQTTDLLNQSVAYRVGNLNHTDFYQYIKDLCGKNNLSLSRFPAMDDYIRYVLLSEAVNVDTVLRDVNHGRKNSGPEKESTVFDLQAT